MKTSVASPRPFGIHLRIDKRYTALLEQATKMGATACQFFFVPQNKKKQLKVTPEDLESFLQRRGNIELFGHCTYMINPATSNKKMRLLSITTLKEEIDIAKKLGIKYLVLHGGSAKGHTSREEGIKALADILAHIQNDDVTFLVENTTHGGMSICSDLNDFILLRKLLPKTSNVKFCFDTAHSFAYGYNLEETEAFVELLDKAMGTQNIKLIHLNDSSQICGSKIDQHEIPGKGLIGKDILLRLTKHEKLKNIPIIVEPPPCEVIDHMDLEEIVREYL